MNLAPWAAAATGVQVGAAIAALRLAAAEVPPLTLALLPIAGLWLATRAADNPRP